MEKTNLTRIQIRDWFGHRRRKEEKLKGQKFPPYGNFIHPPVHDKIRQV